MGPSGVFTHLTKPFLKPALAGPGWAGGKNEVLTHLTKPFLKPALAGGKRSSYGFIKPLFETGLGRAFDKTLFETGLGRAGGEVEE